MDDKLQLNLHSQTYKLMLKVSEIETQKKPWVLAGLEGNHKRGVKAQICSPGFISAIGSKGSLVKRIISSTERTLI